MNFKIKGNKEIVIYAIAFLLYLIFATVFYFERLNSDSGYYFFKTLNTESLHIEHGRFVLALAELPALIAIKLNCSITAVAIVYSLTHVVFHFLIAWITYTILEQRRIAFCMICLQFLGLRESVFTPQFELYYGITCLLFSFALIFFWESNKEKWRWGSKSVFCLLLLIIAAFFAITSHPVSTLLYLFYFVYFIWIQKKLAGVYILSFFIFLFLYFIWKNEFVSGYENSKFSFVFDQIKSGVFLQYLNPSRFIISLQNIFPFVADTILLFVILFLSLCFEKRIVAAAYYLIGWVLFLFLIWSMFAPTANGDRYVEQSYFILSVAVILPLIDLAISKKTIRIASVFFLFFCVVKIVQFSDHGLSNRQRSKQMLELLKAASALNLQKVYVSENSMNDLYNYGNWSYGFETLIFSQINHLPAITITKKEDIVFDSNVAKLKSSDWLFRQWEREPVSLLNNKYFTLPENKNYQYMQIESKYWYRKTIFP